MALTVVPVLAYFFVRKVNIKVDENGELPETIWQRIYTPVLELALRSRVTRWATAGHRVAAVRRLAVARAPAARPQFIDAGGETILDRHHVPPPTGASADAVLARTAQVEDLLLADPEVELVQSDHPG